MVPGQTSRDTLDAMRAQHLVCGHLTRACRQAMAEIALDEIDEPAVRQRAVQLLKEVLADWSDAQRWLRTEISRRQKASSFNAPLIAVNNSLTRRAYPITKRRKNMHRRHT